MMNEQTKKKLDKWVADHYEWYLGEVKKNIAYGKMSDYAEDLVHTIIFDLYRMKDEKMDQLLRDNKLKGYILRGASLQIRSSTSPFYTQFRRHKLSVRSGIIDSNSGNIYDEGYIIDTEPPEELMDCFDRAQEQLHWYLKTIFTQKFKEGKSLQEIYEYYNITKRHLVKDLNKAINEIRDICKDAV